MTTEDRPLGSPAGISKSVLVEFSGEFDIASKEQLRGQLDALARVQRLCLDLSAVEYIDSTAIGELIRLHKQRLELGLPTETLVVGQNQPIRRLLGILHMDSLFAIEEHVPQSFTVTNDEVSRRCVAFRDGILQATPQN